MLYAVFYQARCTDGKLASLMGSDSYCPIDGRYSPSRAAQVAIDHAARLAGVQSGIIGFELRRGSIGQSGIVSRVQPLPGMVEQFCAARERGFVSW